MRLLAREALKVVKDKAPAIVDERILPTLLDEISDYVGEIMGKMTTLLPESEVALRMVHGIIWDRLAKEIIEQLQSNMLDNAEKRFSKLPK